MAHLFWADLLRNSAFSPICTKQHVKSYKPLCHRHAQINSDMVELPWLSCVSKMTSLRGKPICPWEGLSVLVLVGA